MTRFGDDALHHALRRDNDLETIELLLEYEADPTMPNERDGRSAAVMAAHRGRGDVLVLLEQRGMAPVFGGVDRLIAACATADRDTAHSLMGAEVTLTTDLMERGGTLLAEFGAQATSQASAICSIAA